MIEKYDWSKNFREDGKRGVCPRCDEHFNIEREQTLRSQLLLHYLDKHKNETYEARYYIDKLYQEIEEDLKK